MATKQAVSTLTGKKYSYVDQVIGEGGVKVVYFSPKKDYVVGFFKHPLGAVGLERITELVGRYRSSLYSDNKTDVWDSLFCWPYDIVESEGRLGIVATSYDKRYSFKYGSANGDALGIAGAEKEGKWFANARFRYNLLDPREVGDWKSYLQVCLKISRAVRKLHALGLSHSDLSYKNVLIDPLSQSACLIDLDSLVVPDKFPPEVLGTPDFIAPEVLETRFLDPLSPDRKLPSANTDRHALAVLIYMYLLCRHPLKGGMTLSDDPAVDEDLKMGSKALFVEHPTNPANRVKIGRLKSTDLPWGDPKSMPATIVGPHLDALFKRAFVDALHDPKLRPSAAEWEDALVRTLDMIQPCGNKDCRMQWYVFDNQTKPACPLCSTPYSGKLPMLNLYSGHRMKDYRPLNRRLMVWEGQTLFKYHIDKNVFPDENIKPEDDVDVGYFAKQNGLWYLVNTRMPELSVIEEVNGVSTKVPVGLNQKVQLERNKILLFGNTESALLAQVQIAN